ncbi:MAG: CotH kinase family protein [Bacteroidales bacterium]|nr:CotH kinase family protein [Bacteroidales bacterium]
MFIFLTLLAVACGKQDVIIVDDSPPKIPERVIPVLPENGTVPEILITVKESEWQRLLDAYNKNKDTQEYIRCNVQYSAGSHTDAVVDAGLRLKGNTSRRYPGEAGALKHVHFGLHFNEYVEGQKLLGVNRLDLKWFKDDPAYCREIFCYDLFQRAEVWTAISAGYTKLRIKVGSKETYMGVYILMEHVRGDYVKHREHLFGGRDGHLWKAKWGASLKDPNARMGADDNLHDYTYELKSDESDFQAAKDQLQSFIRKFNSMGGDAFYAWAEQNMDVPLLLRTYAVNVLVGMWDDYWTSGNNYYFYFNPAGKFYFIPYDYDNTLGTSQYYDSGRQDPLHWGDDSANPLVAKLLERPEWKEYYINCLKTLAKGDFRADVAIARINGWHQVISPYVRNDTGQDMKILDRPASWGNHSEYRILDLGSNNNFFSVKYDTVVAL